MSYNKQTYLTGLALFSLFFGAGNLILPPFLGYNSGNSWVWVLMGFIVTGVIIPILAIYGYSKIQGTLFDFAKTASPTFSVIFCIIIYTICVILPAPRTAAVTHEIAIAPIFNSISSFITSLVYFILVAFVALQRSKILDFIGKFLTPLLLLVLFIVFTIHFIEIPYLPKNNTYNSPIVTGVLEGYQTFDAIGGMVVGGVLVVSLNFKKNLSTKIKQTIIARAGILAGLGLTIVYGLLLYIGAGQGNTQVFENRTLLLSASIANALGFYGTIFFSVLIALACFTTAVGIIAGTADFIASKSKNPKKNYTLAIILSCFLGIIFGQLPVETIISVAVPVLIMVYPVSIVLILLHALPEKFTSAIIFKAVIYTTIVFTLPELFLYLLPENKNLIFLTYLPFSSLQLGWVLPTIISYIIFYIFNYKSKNKSDF